MKDYKEMAKCVLEARDAYDAKKGKKRPDGSEVHKLQNPESNNRKDDNDNRNGKRKVWFYAPVLSGLAAAAAIAFIVSDHSIDRQEEKTTEIVSEATEEEATEMPVTTEEAIQERATVSVRKEKDEQTPEVNKQKQGSEGVKVDSELSSDQGEKKKTDSEKQTYKKTKKDDQETGVTDRDKTEQKETSKEKVIIPDTEAVTEEETTSNQDTSPEKDDPDNKTPENNESQVNVDTSLASNWQQVLQGEGDITYVIEGEPVKSGPGFPMCCQYRKCYKGFKTIDYAWFYFDGTRCTDQASVDSITTEMLQSVDFSNAERNLKEIEEKMAAVNYERKMAGPGMPDPLATSEPLIKIDKSTSSLVCSLAYQRSGSFTEASEEMFIEFFGCSSYGPEGHSWNVTFDIITGKIIAW